MQVHELKIDRQVPYVLEIERLDHQGRSIGFVSREIPGPAVIAELKALEALDLSFEQPDRTQVVARTEGVVVSLVVTVLRPVAGDVLVARCERCKENHRGAVTEVDDEARTYVMDASGGPAGHQGEWTDIVRIEG